MNQSTNTIARAPPRDKCLQELRALVSDDMTRVDACIQGQLHSDIKLVREVSRHLIDSGGKRLRPLLLLLSAHAFHCRGLMHITLAAALEFIHSATLLHDDVVDTSDLRRGNPTASHIWGNPASVLIGDFLYSRAVEMLVSTGNLRIVGIMAETTNTIVGGEVLQLQNSLSTHINETQYFEIIASKTAKLFEAAAMLGPVLSAADETSEKAMAEYGKHLGIAFQLMDDLLDYTGERAQLGKNRGDDLAEGKLTLPLIYAMAHANDKQRQLLIRALQNPGRALFEQAKHIIEITGALAYTMQRAQQQAQQAKDALATIPESAARADLLQSLSQFADFAMQRAY